MRKLYSYKQMVLSFVGFVLIMGVVGYLEQSPDYSSVQAQIDEKTAIRDALAKKSRDDQKIWLAYYSGVYRWSKSEEGR